MCSVASLPFTVPWRRNLSQKNETACAVPFGGKTTRPAFIYHFLTLMRLLLLTDASQPLYSTMLGELRHHYCLRVAQSTELVLANSSKDSNSNKITSALVSDRFNPISAATMSDLICSLYTLRQCHSDHWVHFSLAFGQNNQSIISLEKDQVNT